MNIESLKLVYFLLQAQLKRSLKELHKESITAL